MSTRVRTGSSPIPSSSAYCAERRAVDGAALATRHPLESGRSTVATITGPQDMAAMMKLLLDVEPSINAVFAEPYGLRHAF
jgi:hypothetical protein